MCMEVYLYSFYTFLYIFMIDVTQHVSNSFFPLKWAFVKYSNVTFLSTYILNHPGTIYPPIHVL